MMRRRTHLLGLLTVAVIVGLVVYAQSFSSSPYSPGFVKPEDKITQSTKSNAEVTRLALSGAGGMPLEEPVWLTEASNDPDPRVRLQAIEIWANYPGENLNPFAYALVDPDESVRNRARELFEDFLAQRKR